MNRASKLVVIAAMIGIPLAHAQPPAAPEAKPKAADKAAAKVSSKKPPKIDPNAITALNAMGSFLRAQTSFTVKTKSATDQVLENGQKVQLMSQGELKVSRPDRLFADIKSDRRHRQFYYDGSTFTMNGPTTGYWTKVEAPATIGELAEVLENRYGLELPLVDLFYWGTDKASVDDIKAATVVGPATIDGVETDQYAFTQDGLEWQIWIERGKNPIPRRMVLTTLTDTARPQHEIEMAWELGVVHPGKTFAFTPPKDSKEIALVEINPERSAAAVKPKTKKQ